MNKKILCVDDEPNVLEAYQRSLRRNFQLETALSGEAGLAAITHQGPYAVVVSDMRMPGMDGVQFLAQVKEKSPDSVRIMLTGNADQQTAMDAVNEGNIFRFLTKPCAPDVLAKTLIAGIEQHRLITAERELLGKTLRGSVKMLTDILSLINPTAFGRASRVRELVRHLAAALKIEDAWQVELAAMLSQVGCITVPEKVLNKVYTGSTLTGYEFRMVQSHPQIGRNLVANIPRLEGVAEIIGYQEKCFNGSGAPDDDIRGEDIPLGARILKLALDFEKLVEASISNSVAYEEIKRKGDWYDPSVIEALKTVIDQELEATYEVRFVTADDLTPTMIIADDIYAMKGQLLIAKGQEVTLPLCIRLINFARLGVIAESIKVLIPIKKRAESDVDISTVNFHEMVS